MKILVTGAKGQLGTECLRVLGRGADTVGVDLPELDVCDEGAVCGLTERERPDWIVNCAAYTDVDGSETNREAAWRVNVAAARHVATAAASTGAGLVHLSTDYVFDGERPPPRPYVESDPAAPRCYYGVTKREGEKAILAVTDRAAILRTAWLYGAHGRNFLKTMQRLAAEPGRQPIRVVNDQHGSPTWAGRLAEQIRVVIDNGLTGILHASGEGHCTWYELARFFFEQAGLEVDLVPCATAEFPTAARRPRNSILENARLKAAGLNIMTDWREDVLAFAGALRAANGAAS
jgi:dTDP-4-dehydrorhamnose reductase